MFIGQVDETSISFARPRGAKDRVARRMGLPKVAKVKEFRKEKRKNLGRLAAGLGAAAVLGAGIKNRKAIGSGIMRRAKGAARTAGLTSAIMRANR